MLPNKRLQPSALGVTVERRGSVAGVRRWEEARGY